MSQNITSRLTQLAFLSAAASIPLSSQALIINQSIDNGAGQVQHFAPVGQSFLASDADIGSVALFVNPFNTSFCDPTLEMALFSGAGVFSSGAKLIGNVFTLDAEFYDWLYFDVSSINFIVGNSYTIGVFNDTPQWGVSNSASDVYTEGTAYFNGAAAGNDLTFRVSPKTAVPEPGVFILIAVGLLLLSAMRRRVKFAGLQAGNTVTRSTRFQGYPTIKVSKIPPFWRYLTEYHRTAQDTAKTKKP